MKATVSGLLEDFFLFAKHCRDVLGGVLGRKNKVQNQSLTDHDAEIPAWIPEKYFLTVNFEAL